MRKIAIGLCVALCLIGTTAPALADTRTFYEIFPASFYDSGADGVGDLIGVAQKLPYLAELGVGGVWLMPIHPSPSYHKYDVVDYLAVDPDYGTLDDMRSLLAALAERDMVLLMDLVLNHTSSRHAWFLSAIRSLPIEPCGGEACANAALCRAHNPYVGYYRFANESVPGWHPAPGAPGWTYEGGFSADMPDLNLENEAVLREIRDIAAFWLGMGVGGFRLDAAAHYIGENTEANAAFLAWFMDTVRARNPDAYVVAEVWKDAGTIARYYESGVPSLFNFPFSGAEGAIVSAIRTGNGAGFASKAEAWQSSLSDHPGASDAVFLSNHDNARIAGTLMKKPENLKLAASLYLTLPGTPFLYYGEEIGLTGSGRDENKRLPMVWDEADPAGLCLPPKDADQKAAYQADVAASMADPSSLWHHYRVLLALRAQHPALRTGVLAALDTGIREVCAYSLTAESEQILVLHNLGDDPVALEQPDAELAGALGDGDLPRLEGVTLHLPPLSTAVLVRGEK